MELRKESIVNDELLNFVYDNYPRARQKSIQASDQLLTNGIIDSLGLLSIITFIEVTYSISIPYEDVVVENFGSIESMTNYIIDSINITN